MRVPSFSRALLMGPRIARGPTQKMRNAVMRPSRLNDPPLPLPWNLATSFSSLDLKWTWHAGQAVLNAKCSAG
jgi:hypothetical protein